jgi:hypothetical protein
MSLMSGRPRGIDTSQTYDILFHDGGNTCI